MHTNGKPCAVTHGEWSMRPNIALAFKTNSAIRKTIRGKSLTRRHMSRCMYNVYVNVLCILSLHRRTLDL